MTIPAIRSRKVRGFLRALERMDALRHRYDAKLAALEPLRRRRDRAADELRIRAAALNGTQGAEADRIWRQRAETLGTDATTHRFMVS